MTHTLGIIGGLGTETSCTFCFRVNHALKRQHRVQPHILMDNVPISDEALDDIAHGVVSEEAFQLLRESVQRLNHSSVSVIVMPCNTLHIHLEELRALSQVPILSIIEETAKECQRKGLNKVGLLASTMTVKAQLYAEELKKRDIGLVLPAEDDQNFIAGCILRIIDLCTTAEDGQRMKNIMDSLCAQGAQAIILGCTDLFLLVSEEAVRVSEEAVPVINSTAVLEKAAVKWMAVQRAKQVKGVEGSKEI